MVDPPASESGRQGDPDHPIDETPDRKPKDNSLSARLAVYSAILSTFALVATAGAYYEQYVAVRHSLILIVPKAGLDDNQLPVEFSFQGILLNRGNRTEVIVSSNISLDASSATTYFTSASGPMIIEPGKAALLNLQGEVREDTIQDADTRGGGDDTVSEAVVDLRVDVIAPAGGVYRHLIPLGIFGYASEPEIAKIDRVNLKRPIELISAPRRRPASDSDGLRVEDVRPLLIEYLAPDEFRVPPGPSEPKSRPASPDPPA